MRGVLLDRHGRQEGVDSLDSILRESRAGQRNAAAELQRTGMLEIDQGVFVGKPVLHSTLMARLAAAKTPDERIRIERTMDSLVRSSEKGGVFEPRASLQTWQETLITATADGPTLTAAAAASAINTNTVITLPNNFFYIGRVLKVTAQGRISNVITTPGTARFDIRVGAVIAFDTGAINLNVAAKTNVPFWLEILLTCRSVGNGVLTTLMGQGQFQSESVVGSPANTAGGNGSLLAPVGAPAVGTGFNNQLANTLDMFFTQTVNTGSMTIHQYKVESLN